MSQTIERRLAYLGYQLIPPSPALRPYVRSYWLMRRDKSLGAYHEEFMHAGGNFGMAFNLGDGLRLDQQPLRDVAFMDGATTQSRRMGFEGQVHLLGVQFQTGAAYPFLGIPLGEMVNQTALMDIVGEGVIMPLYERIRAAATLREQVAVIEEWLIGRLAAGRTADALVWESARMIRQQQGILSIETLMAHLAIGHRQLERLYYTQVGVSPKQYARVLRVNAARAALKQVGQTSLTDLGLTLGFYDQSHFIREFKGIVGMTPSAYRAHSLAVGSGSGVEE